MPKKNNLSQLIVTAEKIYNPKFEVVIITLQQDLINLCVKLAQAQTIAITVQGTNVDPMISTCAGISIAYNSDQVYFIPRHNNENVDSLSLRDVIANLQPIFANLSIEKILYHAAFDQILLQQIGLPMLGKLFDIKAAAQLIADHHNESSEPILQNFYSKQAAQPDQHHAIFNQKLDQSSTIERCLWENIAQTHQTLFLHDLLQSELKQQNLIEKFESLIMPVHQILVTMQTVGIGCNQMVIKKIDDFMSKKLESLMYEINSYSITPIDINNVSQLSLLLCDTLKMPGKRKFAHLEKNQDSKTIIDAFDALLEENLQYHAAIPLIILYHKIFAYKKTVLDQLPQYINQTTGKIHPFWQQSMHQLHPITSTHPNLDTISNNNFDYKVSLRSAFTAMQGHILCAIDYTAQDDLLLLLLQTHRQIAIHNLQATILAVTADSILIQFPDNLLEQFKTIFPHAQVGENWQKASR